MIARVFSTGKGTEVRFVHRSVLHKPANLHPGFATVTQFPTSNGYHYN